MDRLLPETRTRLHSRNNRLWDYNLFYRYGPMQKVRDECIALHGPESVKCQQLIENHKACLRAEGFNVRFPHV
jgi:hypothetical protein